MTTEEVERNFNPEYTTREGVGTRLPLRTRSSRSWGRDPASEPQGRGRPYEILLPRKTQRQGGEKLMRSSGILVVEDGQSQREMLRDFFGRRGTPSARPETANGLSSVSGRAIKRPASPRLQDPGMDGIAGTPGSQGIQPRNRRRHHHRLRTIETAVGRHEGGRLD